MTVYSQSRSPSSTPAVQLAIEGMSCASCVGRVERVLLAQPGVNQATVNLATERATIQGEADAAMLAEAVTAAGYPAKVISDPQKIHAAQQQKKQQQLAVLRRDVGYALLFTLPIFILEMAMHLSSTVQQDIDRYLPETPRWYLECILTSIVLFFPGRRFYQHGLPALWQRAPDMNSLVAIGTLAAWGFSLVATFVPHYLPAGSVHVYYEAAAMIVTLVLIGRYLEARAKGKTSQAIQRLIKLQPNQAHLWRDEQSVEIATEQLQLGDVVEVRPGERVPIDGEVVFGSSYLDESMISGEPLAVGKQVGDNVTGGTINQQGYFRFTVNATGEQTLLAQIIHAVEQAQASKLPIQSQVDKVTLWFVPAVLLAALLTLIAWLVLGPSPSLSLAIVNAVAVLIIACPCAMGLATPTSIMVATGRAAEQGILFRQGSALQQLRDVKLVAFDKTGTLTEGKPALTDLEVAAGWEPPAVLQKLASVERYSEHPLAQAIVDAAQQQQITLVPTESFTVESGMGVRARINDETIVIGADRYMASLDIAVEPFAQRALQLAEQGKTPFYMAIDQQLVAIIAVADPIKPSAQPIVQRLQAQGVTVAMITGDNQVTANAVAQQIGITQVTAEVKPQGKVAAIKQWQQRYGDVAFVGDGINDAPALAAAEVGIALGSGTDIAMESADVVLMSGNLSNVSHAITLSRATITNIHQNLFWAFVYNLALIPVAAGALYPNFGILLSPVIAAGAMALSSVFVLTNALRLKRITFTDK